MHDGVRLYFQKLGNGPETLVILNGFVLIDDFSFLSRGRNLIFLDLRNRGRSEFVTDATKLRRGIHQDVDDLEAVREHLGLTRVDVLGHSYCGLTVVLYAMKFPSQVGRIVQIGAIPPDWNKQYPPHLTNIDATLRDFFAGIQELEKQRATTDPKDFCKKFWSFLRLIYVSDPADSDKIRWERCDLQTEVNLMKYWLGSLLPSIEGVKLNADDLARVACPVLTVHGTKDRSSPYGGALDWASMLPHSQLLTVDGAAHAPWIEAPEQVFTAIQSFLDRS
jgi:pimeloyl-ACP methyl ester carboxylesterase